MSCSVGAFNAAYHTKIGVYHREMGIKKGGKLVVIGHGDCPDDVEQLRQAVRKEFPDADIRVAYIGPVIGAHTGCGTLGLFFVGTER